MKNKRRKSKGPPPPSRSQTVKAIRKILGRSQTELAMALGISAKAVQSYEQGWRKTPVRVMIQLMVLLALYRQQSMDDVPCWEIRRCPPDSRSDCPAFTVGRGKFCWFIGSKTCPPPPGGEDRILPCMDCPVVRRLLRGSDADGARAKPGPRKKTARSGKRPAEHK